MNFAIWHGRLHFDFEWNYLFLADLLFFKSFLIFYNLVNMLHRSPVFKRGQRPFSNRGTVLCLSESTLVPLWFNSFSVSVRKQARARQTRHVCYDDLIINWSLWILVSLNVFPLQRPDLLSWVCSILVIIITVTCYTSNP